MPVTEKIKKSNPTFEKFDKGLIIFDSGMFICNSFINRNIEKEITIIMINYGIKQLFFAV